MDYRLIVVRGRSSSEAVPLVDGVTVAGRHEDCQLRIASSQVSRRHCEIFEKKGLLLVKDLGSSNGTFVNGKKIDGQRVMEHGDELTIGPIKFKIDQISKSAPEPGKKKASETAVGGSPVVDADATIALADEELVEVEVEGPAGHAAAGKSAGTDDAKSGSKPPEQPETIEFGEEDVADFLLELDIDDKDQH